MKLGYFILLLLFVSSTVIKAQVTLPDDVLINLRALHPRLLVRSLKDFENLKAAIPGDKFLGNCSKAVLTHADSLLKTQPVEYVLNSQLGGQLLEVSRTVYRRVYVLAMAYRLTGNKKYADKVWDNLYAASQFPDWNPYDFLDVAEMLHGFAIGYDWLYDVWAPEQKKIIKQAMLDKGLLRAYLGYNEMENSRLVDWPNASSNWNQVCSGGIGLAALAIADEEPRLCNYLIKQAVQRIPNTMKKLAPDGASEEGPGYWQFGTQYNVALIASLETALGTDFGLSDLDGFSKTGKYFLAMGSNSGKSFNYADCWTDYIQSPELFWFAKRYDQPLLETYQKAHSLFSPLELLWYCPAIKGGAGLPLDNYYRGGEVATMRSSWNDPMAWFVGFKAGANTANHGHLDLGSFVLEKNGKRWAMDLGHDSYALPGYFDTKGQRWTYYRLKAEGHNTLVMDPDTQADQNTKAFAAINRFVSGAPSSFGIMDISDAYAPKAASVTRGIALQNKKQVLVQDEVRANKPIKDLYWFMQTMAAIEITPNRKTIILTIGGEKLKMQLLSPRQGAFEVLDAKPLPESAQPTDEDANKGIKRIAIHLKQVGQTTIAVVFKDMKDNETTNVKPLKNW